MLQYKVHPALALMPEMSEEDLQKLAEDIQKHGQRVACTIYQGMMLDGRGRQKVSIRLGIPLKGEEWRPSPGAADPFSYVWSLNGNRRHLNAGQRACLALRFLMLSGEWERLYKESKEEANKLRRASMIAHHAGKLHPPGTASKTSKRIGRLVSVSPRSIQRALSLYRSNPKMFDEVISGIRSLSTTVDGLRIQPDQPDQPETIEQLAEVAHNAYCWSLRRKVSFKDQPISEQSAWKAACRAVLRKLKWRPTAPSKKAAAQAAMSSDKEH